MKRILSLLLAFTLLCSLLPAACITAYAANYTTSYNSFTAPDSSDMAYNGGKNSGTTTSEIKWMQAALNYCIQYKGLSATLLDVDGVFGAASAAATKAFQSKYGLTADGYFGSGTIAKMKSVLSGSTTSTTTPTKVTVTLDNQGATTFSVSRVTATYGSAMPTITVPTKPGYTFGGFFTSTNGNGTKYYTSAGTSARTWDKTVATTLYAKWTANSTSTGTSTSYDTSYSSYTAPDSSDSAHNGGKNSTTTVSEVKWMQAALNYCIKYKGLVATPLVVDGDFGAASAAATTAFQNKYGLTADGWFGSGTIAKMKEVLGLSTAAQTCKITLNSQGATTAGTASVTATYGSAMPSITVPTKTGCVFGGYYSARNGGGVQYYTCSGASARTWNNSVSSATLYAKWIDDSTVYVALGSVVTNLGSGWTFRIDEENPLLKQQRHIHITDGRGNEYMQNEDGSPHDKMRGVKGKIPNWVNKKIKDNPKSGGWDYNQKYKDFFDATKAVADPCGLEFYTFADGSTITVWVGTSSAIYFYQYEDIYFGVAGSTSVTGVTANGTIPITVLPNIPVPPTIEIPIQISMPAFAA